MQTAASAERVAAEPTQRWAILVGIEKYHRATHLRHTINDVEQIERTLRDRGNFPEENILKIVDSQTNPRFQPLRNSLSAELPKFLAQPKPNDTILIYFSGHGFRGPEDGKLYLAPIDCDPENPAPTGIAVDWLRGELAKCQAGFKLLVLDACHAGTEKGDDKRSIGARDLGTPFEDVKDVVTLASSTGDEKSQIWEEKRQSLFSYWFNQGLKGHADQGDGRVDIDELYRYVHRQVKTTASQFFPHSQTPVRIVRSGIPGVPVILELKPQGLKPVVADMAEQLAWMMQANKLSRLGVLEFTNVNTSGKEYLGTDFGLLGRYCAEELERYLKHFGDDKISVVNRRSLQKSLQTKDFRVEKLGDEEELVELAESVSGGMHVVVLGTIRNRINRIVSLRAELLQIEGNELVGAVGGTAVLNESDWAMLGFSGHVKVDDRRPEGPLPDDEEELHEVIQEQVISKLDERADDPHPLFDPTFPYRIRIMVEGEERQGKFIGNNYVVPLRKGESFTIQAQNQSGRLTLMRLLVDGLNTLPEKINAKNGTTKEVGAMRVSLSDARAWILDPDEATQFVIKGFFERTGDSGSVRPFRVVDAQNSFAARQSFTDQLGMITAAFYARGDGKDIGIGGDDPVPVIVKQREGVLAGNLLAVINIRYIEPEAFATLRP